MKFVEPKRTQKIETVFPQFRKCHKTGNVLYFADRERGVNLSYGLFFSRESSAYALVNSSFYRGTISNST